jgi:hypothetical protein
MYDVPFVADPLVGPERTGGDIYGSVDRLDVRCGRAIDRIVSMWPFDKLVRLIRRSATRAHQDKAAQSAVLHSMLGSRCRVCWPHLGHVRSTIPT